MTIQSNFPSLKPSLLLDFANTKRLDPRITFTRASTARYYDGVTQAQAEQNLLKYSQNFDNAAWGKSGVSTVSNSTTAPDGTATAYSIVEDTSTGLHYVNQAGYASPGAVVQTFSVYLKAESRSRVRLDWVNSDMYQVVFELSGSGAVVSQGGSITSAGITSVGNGWYRCVVTFIPNGATANLGIKCVDSGTNSSYVGNGLTALYIWGAQLEQRSQVTAYTPTTDQPITKYQPVLKTAASGVPRFDHNPVTGESLGLLIEEQRTNLLTYSADFDNAAYFKYNTTITANAVIAPDGTLAADKLVPTTTNGPHNVEPVVSIANATTHTFSVFAKAGELSFVRLALDDSGSSGAGAYFNLLSGQVGYVYPGVTASIFNAGNGFYRCAVTRTSTGTTAYPKIYAAKGSTNAGGDWFYAGDGTSGIYIWGAQLEVGRLSTSYIPTTTAQVTRAADSASMTGANFSSWYRQGEGTLIVSGFPVADTGLNRAPVSITDGSNANRIHPYWAGNVSSFNIANSFGAQQGISGTYGATPNVLNMFGMAFKENDAVGSVSGVLTAVDSAVFIPPVNQMWIGSLNGTVHCGTIKRIAYYPKRLSNTELQALTTP